MTTPIAATVPSSTRIGAIARRFASLSREPLIQFLLLGGALFVLDAWLHPPKKDDHLIVVTQALRKSFVDSFDEDKSRVPDEQELHNMVDAWVASEILYREGKAMGVDRGDEMIRDRVAYKLQLLIFDQVKVESPTEDQLRIWFIANHERFDEPEVVGFYYGPATDEKTARGQLAAIRNHHEPADLQQQTRAVLNRAVAAVAAVFGQPFLTALLASPVGEWTAIQATDGWHVVRLDSRRPGSHVPLDAVRDQAVRQWETDETRKRAWDAVNRLKVAYKVKYEP